MTEKFPLPSKFTEETIASGLAQKFGDKVKVVSTKKHRVYLNVDKSALLAVCTEMRDVMEFEQCSCVTAVDMKDRFQVVYHLTSYSNKVTAEIVVDNIDHDNPEVDSVAPLWGGANWHEREQYDLMGIVFKGHPRLERIMLPEEYTFHPLRKDFEVGRRV
jgi:NADH-quinone oxidoreductase subunit C